MQQQIADTYTREYEEVGTVDLRSFLAFEILRLIRAFKCQSTATTRASLLFALRRYLGPASEVDLPFWRC